MKADMSELKRRLLNPYDGAIVEIRKNTESRHDWEKQSKELEALREEHRTVVKWKGNFTKVFWTIFTTGIGIAAYLLTNILNK